MRVPEVTLSSGHKMPVIGMGTGAISLPPPEELTGVMVEAMEVGYRHFDTASIYTSEESLGKAVEEAIKRGLIKNREEVFITTKLWCTDTHPDLVLPALQKSLKNLGMKYVDLYLIHFPVRVKEGTVGYDIPKDAIFPLDIKGTWKAMEDCRRLGLAKSIGVSNFSSKKLSVLLQDCTIPPAVNQVELNTTWQQRELIGYCRDKGIQVSAWSPLGAYGSAHGSDLVMKSSLLQEIALAKGKTLAQVALRWVYEQGVIIIVRSFNKQRMKQNLDIFDFSLTEEDHSKIRRIPQKKAFAGDIFVSEQGPYKSCEELWDCPLYIHPA